MFNDDIRKSEDNPQVNKELRLKTRKFTEYKGHGENKSL